VRTSHRIEVTSGARTALTLTGRRDAACQAGFGSTTLVFEWERPPDSIDVTDQRAVDEFPGSVAGLEVVAVDDALAIRDADDDREIAVKGTFTLDAPSDCGDTEVGPLLDPGCRSPARAGSLRGSDGGEGIRFVTPNPDDLGSAADGAPVVLVGHFDDSRAGVCGNEAACRDVFVVDGLWIDGRLTAGSWSWASDGSEPPFTLDVIHRLLPDVVPDERVLSIGALRGSDLGVLEPMAAGTSAAAAPWVWHVTRVDGGRVRTYIVTEAQAQDSLEIGERRFYEEMADGSFEEMRAVTIVD
jgi:hypothetical protein